MTSANNKPNIKIFFIKLIAISVAIIVIINMTYNLIFADNFNAINKLLSLNEKKNIEKFGTIFNTVKLSCKIKGNIKCVLNNVNSENSNEN